MEPTITQTGALYALQHGVSKNHPDAAKKWLGADRIRALPTRPTSKEKFTIWSVLAGNAQSVRQNTRKQVADRFAEYRVAA